jgi:hypothetical protein
VLRLLVAADVPSSPILITLMKEAIPSSETSVLAGATSQMAEFFNCTIPERMFGNQITYQNGFVSKA